MAQKRAVNGNSGLAYGKEFEYQGRMKRNSDKTSIDDLARKLAESVPAGLRSMREELEQNFRAVLRSGLDRLELVTREEFEVQRLVLERTREKLDALGERLAELEAGPAKKASARKKAAKHESRAGSTSRKKSSGGSESGTE